MQHDRQGFTSSAAGNGTAGGSGMAETEVLPPYVPPGNEGMRVRIDRATMQNPCFWILIGVVGTVAVGALIVYASNNRD